MRKIIMLFLLTMLCLFNSNVYAEEVCDTSYINRLKGIAKNVEITYEHNVYGDIDSTDPDAMLVSVFDFTVSGLTNEMYIMDDSGNAYYSEEAVDGVINIMTSSGNRKMYIYSRDCSGELLNTRTFNLPVFNFNSMSDECKREEFKDLEICAEFISEEDVIQGDEFDKKIEDVKKDNSTFNKVINFVKEYAFVFMIVVIILVIMVVLFSYKHYKRSVLE